MANQLINSGGINVNPAFKNSKFVIGGPRVSFQNSNVGNVTRPTIHDQMFQQFPMSSANLASQFLGQMAASAAQIPQFLGPMAASAAQMPGPMAASAAQMPPNFGPMAASAAPMPRSSATPLSSPAPIDANASPLSSILTNSALTQFIHNVQASSNKPVMPWEALAMVHESFVQDPSMPKGFKRLSVTNEIEAAKKKRAQLPVHFDISKAVKYPVMLSFSKSEFLRVRNEYVAAIKVSTLAGMFNSFKSCFDTTASNTAKMVFKLSSERQYLTMHRQGC